MGWKWKWANWDVFEKRKQWLLFEDLTVNGGTDLNIDINVSNNSLTQVENKFKKNVDSVYAGRLMFFILTAGMNYLRIKYGKDVIQKVFDKKYKNVDDFMSYIDFSWLDNIVLITFWTWDVIKFCKINDLQRFHIVIKEVKENANITLEDVVEDINDKSIYEGSLLADYYLDANDKTIKFHINIRVLLAYLYKLTVKGYENVKLSDINRVEGSINELILYLNLIWKFKYKEVVYNIDTIKSLFKKNDINNKDFIKFLWKLVNRMNKKKYPYLIDIESIKLGRKVKQIKFKFCKNKSYQEPIFSINQNILWENLKEDIKKYFDKKYSIKLNDNDIDYISLEVTTHGISLNDFVKVLPSNVTKQQIFNVIEIMKYLFIFKEILSREEKEKIIKKLIENNRDDKYLYKWISYVENNSRIENKKAYLFSVIDRNSEPTEYKDKFTPKNFLKNKNSFEQEFKVNTVKI